MYRIMRQFEIKPGTWSSTPIRVASSPSKDIADREAAASNEVEGYQKRRLRNRYFVITDTAG